MFIKGGLNLKGYVQVYTGNGKGKTTAAIGISIRALGAGKRVLFLQFMKTRAYSEHKIMTSLEPNLITKALGKPFFVAVEGMMTDEERGKWQDKVVIFPPGQPPKEYLTVINAGLQEAKQAVQSGEYDLVVLDEINCALHFGLVSWDDLLDIIDTKASTTELILTGRGATAELIERADLVTEMKEIKHYYATEGLEARLGIEN
ncbi:cob(I)yrinic acid a,c-diamide adenosyltransferase [Anaerosporomusa subterranea]|uniref:Cob(I)yrinic acid a,c-diamide adenosyltransferase n=1 Tax=Anaerosporomusa subterranea TaxID=1794912 RepID=A0A154BNB9_ANASB|nr:cob(I)yrinic acid a,c-diamide adenosyltransferase [Anaerosporomusa subterranea]